MMEEQTGTIECRYCSKSWDYGDDREKGAALILRQRHEEKEHGNDSE